MTCSAVKYRNLKVVNYKAESQFVDLKVGGSNVSNRVITVNMFWLAVIWRHSPAATNSSIGILPTDRSKHGKGPVTLLSGHTGIVTDMAWNPFFEWMLASSATDGSIKLWILPENGPTESSDVKPAATFSGSKKRIDSIAWHPAAANLLASGESDHIVRVWDVNNLETQKLKTGQLDSGINCLSWNYDGSLLSVTSKKNKLYVIDPRTGEISMETALSDGAASNNRICWLGDSCNVLTSGLDKSRTRTVSIWDTRSSSKPLHTKKFGFSPSIMHPTFDNDTKLLFMFARGDSTIYAFGFSDNGALSEISAENVKTPHHSICVAPKLLCDLQNGNVARIYRATDKVITPMGYQVFRKNLDMSEFQLRTPSTEPALTSSDWLSGQNKPPILVDVTNETGVLPVDQGPLYHL